MSIKLNNSDFLDIIPKKNIHGNYLSSDLKIIDFELYHFRKGANSYNVPIYILTDLIICCDDKYYETMVRIGFSDNFDFLSIQERTFSKLQAYHHHINL